MYALYFGLYLGRRQARHSKERVQERYSNKIQELPASYNH